MTNGIINLLARYETQEQQTALITFPYEQTLTRLVC